jgi:hypothetical protein
MKISQGRAQGGAGIAGAGAAAHHRPLQALLARPLDGGRAGVAADDEAGGRRHAQHDGDVVVLGNLPRDGRHPGVRPRAQPGPAWRAGFAHGSRDGPTRSGPPGRARAPSRWPRTPASPTSPSSTSTSSRSPPRSSCLSPLWGSTGPHHPPPRAPLAHRLASRFRRNCGRGSAWRTCLTRRPALAGDVDGDVDPDGHAPRRVPPPRRDHRPWIFVQGPDRSTY